MQKLINLKGIVEFAPPDVTKKHIKQSSWKRVAIIKTNCDLADYYRWFIEKRFNLILNKNLRGTHVTIVSDKVNEEIFNNAAKLYDGKEIEFSIDISPRSNGDYWWLKVYSREAEKIRMSMGLSKKPFFPFHLTLGHPNEKNIDHSHYILRICKQFKQ